MCVFRAVFLSGNKKAALDHLDKISSGFRNPHHTSVLEALFYDLTQSSLALF